MSNGAPNADSIAVGVIFSKEKKILVALRPTDKALGGLWEFPGGKIEPGETVEAALKRELWEEVGIVVKEARPLTQCQYAYQDREVCLNVWSVHEFEGEAHGREGQPVVWVTLKELSALPMLSANHPIVEILLR